MAPYKRKITAQLYMMKASLSCLKKKKLKTLFLKMKNLTIKNGEIKSLMEEEIPSGTKWGVVKQIVTLFHTMM